MAPPYRGGPVLLVAGLLAAVRGRLSLPGNSWSSSFLKCRCIVINTYKNGNSQINHANGNVDPDIDIDINTDTQFTPDKAK